MYQFRNFAVWIVIALLLFALFSLFQGQVGGASEKEASYSQFFDRVNAGEIKSVNFSPANPLPANSPDGKIVYSYGFFIDEDLKACGRRA